MARTSAMMSPCPAASQEQGSGREAFRPFACDLCKVSLARIKNFRNMMKSVEDMLGLHRINQPNEEEDEEENYAAKRPRQRRIKVEEPNKGSYIQRVWTDVDTEIGLLNGIIDYNTRNGRYPFYDIVCLDDFIANWLQVDVPKHRLIVLVMKLRKKYLGALRRKGGATVDFTDLRNQMAFNLANKIWGYCSK